MTLLTSKKTEKDSDLSNTNTTYPFDYDMTTNTTTATTSYIVPPSRKWYWTFTIRVEESADKWEHCGGYIP